MKCSERKIIGNEKLGKDYYLLKYESQFSEKSIVPGQFISISLNSEAMVLRRPFSIFDVNSNVVSVFYKKVGKGTCILAEKKKGELINVLEVLGKGFSFYDKDRSLAVVSGGIGVAPLYFLAKRLRSMEKDVFIYLGARTELELFFEDDLKKMGCSVCVTTDDGSKNICGTVCCGLEPDCEKNNFDRIYACGPKPMLKAVAGVADKANILCEVSMEEVMGCGFGVCLGCAVKIKTKETDPIYKMVCKDGPVFDSQEIDWE